MKEKLLNFPWKTRLNRLAWRKGQRVNKLARIARIRIRSNPCIETADLYDEFHMHLQSSDYLLWDDVRRINERLIQRERRRFKKEASHIRFHDVGPIEQQVVYWDESLESASFFLGFDASDRELLQMLFDGLPIAHIARHIGISPYFVNRRLASCARRVIDPQLFHRLSQSRSFFRC